MGMRSYSPRSFKAAVYWSTEFRGSLRELSICYKTHGQYELQLATVKRVDRTFQRTPWPPRTKVRFHDPFGEPLLLVVADENAPWSVALGRWRF